MLFGTIFLIQGPLADLRAARVQHLASARALGGQFEAAPPATRSAALPLAGIDRLTLIARELHAQAAGNGLTLSDVSYTPVRSGDAMTAPAMQINARMKGAYPAMKKTVSGLLAAHDGLALDSVALQRASAGDTVLSMELQFSFFYRSGP